MIGEDFKNLQQGNTIVMDGKTYRVEEKDRMGRLKLQQIEYYIDEYQYEGYDTEEAANEEVSSLLDNLKQDLKNLNGRLSELDADDAKFNEIQGEIDKAEELIDDLEFCDIDKRKCGNPFWMHYKDIEEDIEFNESEED